MMLATFLQETMEQPQLSGPYVAIFVVIGLLLYLFVGYCLMQIANKTNTPNGWFGFIPILNYVLLLQIAKKPVWWIILFFIPFVNLIILIIVMVGVCQARGKSGWLVLGLCIPLVNLGVLGYLAFAD
jgi:ABC-type Na+ efflux pump permease subunit